MKALILKDFYNLKKQGRFILGVAILYGIIGMFISGEFFAPFLGILCLILPINIFSFDKNSNWDNYALTLPLTRAQLAVSKYVTGFLLVFCAIALNTIFYGISYLLPNTLPLSATTHLIICYSIFCTASLAFSVLFPFIFKFGVEKSRIILIIIFLLPSITIAALPKLAGEMEVNLRFLSQSSPAILAIVSFVILLSILAISISISIGIINKKDF